MDFLKIGKYIQSQRKAAGMTQKQLAEKMNVSFQAVSKWENGDTLPDASLLLKLADELNTTTDKLLTGGTAVLGERRRMRVADVAEGFQHILAVGRCLGEDSTFYTGMVEGINQKMNIDLIPYLTDPQTREVMIVEALIQGIMKGYTLDMDEVRTFVSNPNMIAVIEGYLAKTEERGREYPILQAADGYRRARRIKEGTIVVMRKASGEIAVFENENEEALADELLSAQNEPVKELVCCAADGKNVLPTARIREGLLAAFPENANAAVYRKTGDGVNTLVLSELA